MTAAWRTTVVLVATLLTPPANAAPHCQIPAADRWFASMLEWLAAVNGHRPGQTDAAIGTAAAKSLADLEATLADVVGLRDRWSSSQQDVVTYRGRKFTHPELRGLFGVVGDEPVKPGVNRLLRRAAVYHADIAIFVSAVGPAGEGGVPRPGRSAIVIGDGRQRATTTSTIHWAFGRDVLDSLAPGPKGDEIARAWYLAGAAYLQAAHMVTESDDHLSRARQIFPDDAQVLFEGACTLETLAGPSIQAAWRAGAPSARARALLPSERSILGRAEQLHRRALQHDPSLIEARVRLARITAARGQHREAIELLQQALAAGPPDVLHYLAAMLLGDDEQAVGRRAAARGHYEEAAQLFPTAQSPLLALGLLARDGSEREAATAALERLGRLPAEPERRVDPWWVYYFQMRGGNVNQRLRHLYALVERDVR